MWKILTAQIKEEIYYSMEYRGLFPNELKENNGKTRGTWPITYRLAHPQRSQNKAGKCSHGMDCL